MKKKHFLGVVIITLLLLTSSNFIFAQVSNRTWWNNLSPAWKKIIRDKELKGKEIDPDDATLNLIVQTTHLSCAYNKEIKDLSPLTQFTNLVELRCNNTNIASLEGIEGLVKLKKLDCSNNDNIISLEPISEMTQLEYLNCGNTMIKNLGPLRGLNNLKELNVEFCTVNTLRVIGKLKNLEKLNISKNIPLYELNGIENLPNLIELNCSETSIESLEPIKYLRNIKILDVSKTNIRSLRDIQMVFSLSDINFSHTNVEATSLDYLYSNTNLRMIRGRKINASKEYIDEFKDFFKKNYSKATVILSSKN